ncbi:hypothetical protein BpHYR1_053185 [Brachionus plicatilis]|uniref:Uncharacterized protein n=1 Tax=Brachionus plicatilis TaxID=10195 RepID=A0A3M7S1X4_BRAPC|nr:hypothetical protein BpHYR1_053185 [Brachionus plicatilis]
MANFHNIILILANVPTKFFFPIYLLIFESKLELSHFARIFCLIYLYNIFQKIGLLMKRSF